MTRTSTALFVASSFNPSCSGSAVNIDGPFGSGSVPLTRTDQGDGKRDDPCREERRHCSTQTHHRLIVIRRFAKSPSLLLPTHNPIMPRLSVPSFLTSRVTFATI